MSRIRNMYPQVLHYAFNWRCVKINLWSKKVTECSLESKFIFTTHVRYFVTTNGCLKMKNLTDNMSIWFPVQSGIVNYENISNSCYPK